MASPEFLRNRRPKAFPLHYDAWQYYPDHNASRVALEAIEEQHIESLMEAIGPDPYKPPKYKHLYRKVKAQFNDPICDYALLDIIVQMQRGIYLRPHHIRDLLNQRWPQYVWSNSVIGRMLGGLNKACKKAYPECEKNDVPFARGRDVRGNYYVVDPKGGDEGLLWLIKARDVFLFKAEAVMDREAVNIVSVLETSLSDYSQPEALYADTLGFRIRNDTNYRASWRPDAHFGPATPVAKPIKSPYGD